MRLIPLMAVFAAFTLSARAEPIPQGGHSCISLGHGVSRVAAQVADPANCCTGRLQCAQFLSTTIVVRPAHDDRT